MERERRTGIIDTISLGYSLVNRRPWLVALPVLLDLFYWFGPRLSIESTIERLVDFIAGQGTTDEVILNAIRQAGAQSDLLGLLAIQIPSIMLDPGLAPTVAGRPVLMVDNPVLIAGASVLLIVLGLLLATVYLTPIAQTVRAGKPDLLQARQRVGVYWLRFLALVGLLLVLALGVTVPLSVLTALSALAGFNLLPVLLALVQVGALWLGIYIFFVVDALLVSEAKPLQAVRYSATVVHHNFWSSLGLIIITLVISWGLTIVFSALARVPAGVPVAIAAHAYISTGLAAASMIFYRDRFARWQQGQRAALNQVGPGASR